MQNGTVLYIVYSVLSILTSSVLAFMFWKRRNVVGALAMALLLFCAADWSFFSFVSALCTSDQSKIFWDNLTFFGVFFIPVLWFIFSLQYTRSEKLLKRKHYYLLFILPVFNLIMLSSNNLHHLFIISRSIDLLPESNLSLISYKFGPVFWIHISYAYTMIMFGIILLVRRLIHTIKIYRNQALLMITAVLFPMIGDIIYLLGLGPFNNLYTGTFSFTIGGILLFIGMFRYRALDLIPIAREAVIEAMDDLVLVLDIQNRIIDINTAARAILGKRYKEIIGKPYDSVIKDIILPHEENGYEHKHNKEIVLSLDGQKKYYKVKVSSIYNKNHVTIGSFIVLMDITDLHETMENLENSRQLAEAASKAKSDFLATMSHEIRTPLNGVIGMSELLNSAKLTKQERENLIALQDSADSLLNIINEILDFSKIEAGKMEIDDTSFNFRGLITSIIKTFEYSRKTELIRLSCTIDESVPSTLIGDYVKLRQILNNLLSNAFKFTEKGEIKLEIASVESSEDELRLRFSVSDTGIGISKDKINSLFESFHQLDSSTTRKYGGTGLGLSIVKKLVVLMGGTIRVESDIDKGSCFIFEIPFKIQEASPDTEVAAAASLENNVQNLKVLVAEDSKVNQMLITQFLAKKNWEAVIAKNGREVLDILESDTFDLILMDIQMPEMDGYEATKAIREKEMASGIHIPIIALTANATEHDRNKCLEYGMDDFLSKPIKQQSLYETILKHV